MEFTNMFRKLPSQVGLLGINARNLECIYPHNARYNFPNVDDKLTCKQLMEKNGIPVPKTYHIVDGPDSLINWSKAVEDKKEFVIKPNRSFGGQGILVVHRVNGNYRASKEILANEDITFHLKQILNGAFTIDNLSDKGYFEEMVINHNGLKQFLPEGINGVCDIRLIYLNDKPIMAMLRVPTRESNGKANLHQGGIGIGIDIESGQTLFGCHKNDIIEKHPEMDFKLNSRTVPFFEDMLNAGSKISKIVGLGYIGIDFVCDNNKGPLVLEVNARPGLNIQIANQAGLRERLFLS